MKQKRFTDEHIIGILELSKARRLRGLAQQRRRFGCRRLHIVLLREGVRINRKRTQGASRRGRADRAQAQVEAARARRPRAAAGACLAERALVA